MTQNLASLAVGISASVTLSIVLKATVLVAGGLLVAKLMRHARAARRFTVLAATFAALLAVPIVVAIAPAVPVVVREIRHVTPLASREHVPVGPGEEGRPPAASPAAATPTGFDADRLSTLALTLWGIGTVVSLLPMLMTLRRLRMWRITARAWNHACLCSAGPPVLIHDELTAPITFGWWRPSVLLPGDAEMWPVADVQRALVHEMEHVERRDWLVHVFARLVCAVYWFHPLVWMAWRQLHLEADRACDDAVASRCDAREFAEQLVTLAGRVRSGSPAPVLSMAGGDLVTRVNALLNPNQARGRTGHRFAASIALGALLVGTAISCVEAVERVVAVPEPAAHTRDARPAPEQALRPAAGPPAVQANQPVAPAPSVRRDAPPAIQPPSPPAPAPGHTDYVIGVADVLSITYWEQKELTADYVVRPDGKITVPLLNDVDAAGLTPSQLRDRLTAISARIFENPRITVGVKAINSRKVYILGGVSKPGPYDLAGGMTVIELIAAAGGLREFVSGRGITILRNEDGQQRVFTFDYREVISGQNLAQNIRLRPGDTVAVPE